MDLHEYDEDERSEKDRIYKQFPWMQYSEIIPQLENGQIRTSHMYYDVLCSLEKYVSAKVFILGKKPKEANHFLYEISEWIWGMRFDCYQNRFRPGLLHHQFYQIFGRLLKHMIVIILASEKLQRRGAAKVIAFQMYNFMKDLLHHDLEYVLDVILTSALTHEINLFAPDKLGYEVFVRVIMDYRRYFGSPAKKMKYCCIATLLSRYSMEGYQFVYRKLPLVHVDKRFAKFVTTTLGYDKIPFELKSSTSTLKTVIFLLEQSGRSENDKVKELSERRLRIKPKYMIKFSVMKMEDEKASSSSLTKRYADSARKSYSTSTAFTNYYNDIWLQQPQQKCRKRKAPSDPFLPEGGALPLRMVIQEKTQKIIYWSSNDNSVAGANTAEPFTAWDGTPSGSGGKVPNITWKRAKLQETPTEDSFTTDEMDNVGFEENEPISQIIEATKYGTFSNQMTTEAVKPTPTRPKMSSNSQMGSGKSEQSPQVPMDIVIKTEPTEHEESFCSERDEHVSQVSEPDALPSVSTKLKMPCGSGIKVQNSTWTLQSLQIPMKIKTENIHDHEGNEQISKICKPDGLLHKRPKMRPGLETHLDIPKSPKAPLDIKPKIERNESESVVTTSPAKICFSSDSDVKDLISSLPIQQSPVNLTIKNSSDLVPLQEPVTLKNIREVEPEVARNPLSQVQADSCLPSPTTSATDPQSPPPPSRRRGRPPKSKKVGEGSDVISNDDAINGVPTTSASQPQSPPPRRRGRPPKSKKVSVSEESDAISNDDAIHGVATTSSSEPQSPSPRRSPKSKKVSVESDVVSTGDPTHGVATTSAIEPQSPTPPTRRRGRPPKSKKVSEESNTISKDDPIHRVATKSASEPQSPTPSILRRGRSSKSKKVSEESDAISNDDTIQGEAMMSASEPRSPPPPSRRRGRPPKSKKVGEGNDVISTDDPIQGEATTSATPLKCRRKFNKGSLNGIPENDPIHEIWSQLELGPLHTSKAG